jgi:hypothetical protein
MTITMEQATQLLRDLLDRHEGYIPNELIEDNEDFAESREIVTAAACALSTESDVITGEETHPASSSGVNPLGVRGLSQIVPVRPVKAISEHCPSASRAGRQGDAISSPAEKAGRHVAPAVPGLAKWDAMAEQPPAAKPPAEEMAAQLAKTEADLRTLGEQLGAIPHSPAKAMSQRRARGTFLVVVAIATLVAWFLWGHWHSVLVATLPLLWIFHSGWRWHRNTRPRDDTN